MWIYHTQQVGTMQVSEVWPHKFGSIHKIHQRRDQLSWFLNWLGNCKHMWTKHVPK